MKKPKAKKNGAAVPTPRYSRRDLALIAAYKKRGRVILDKRIVNEKEVAMYLHWSQVKKMLRAGKTELQIAQDLDFSLPSVKSLIAEFNTTSKGRP